MIQSVEDIIRHPPTPHNQGTRTLRLHESVLRFLDAVVKPDMTTVETGIGSSTALFALKGSRHHCIAPLADEIARLTDYCTAGGLDVDNIQFHADFSEYVLPTLPVTDIDLALIDGGHGFPTPFVDWFYLAGRLKVGGYVLVDDVQLWTCKVLQDFLCADPGWEQLGGVLDRTAVFRMTAPFAPSEHFGQSFVNRRSVLPILAYRFRVARRHMSEGDFIGLVQGVARNIRRVAVGRR